MADMSTIQLNAARPNHGTMSVSTRVNATLFHAVLYTGCTVAKKEGRNLLRPMLNRRRVVAMKKPFMPVRMPASTGTVRATPPQRPKIWSATQPVAQE